VTDTDISISCSVREVNLLLLYPTYVPLIATAKNSHSPRARLLLQASADVNMQVKGDSTASYAAAKAVESTPVKPLIDSGAQFNERDSNEALLEAIRKFEHGKRDAAIMILL
jgi:hypothetical protein